MTKPRQLAPTVGLSDDGSEFLEGSFEGPKGYAVGRMTKSRRGKLYIDDTNWGPDADSVEYGIGSPSAEYTCSSARLVSRISAPISMRRLSVRDPPRPGLP